MIQSVMTIVTKPPYGCEDAFAGLRFALSQIAAGSLEKSDTLLMEDGVYNAVLSQKTEGIGMPSNLEATKDLLDLDGTVYCVKEHLEERKLTPDMLLEGMKVISRNDLAALIIEYDVFTTF